MSANPIFVATHPRACSTAFERVFMTRRDILKCVHEPFGDAYYYGPERLAERFQNDENARMQSGFQNITYKDILEGIDRENAEGKRLFIKDMAQCLIAPEEEPTSIAPSLRKPKRGIGTDVLDRSTTTTPGTSSDDAVSVQDGPRSPQERKINGTYANTATSTVVNPTVMPDALLQRFHFTFLIRHPHYSIPSYYRCTIPPLDSMTGFYSFMPPEAGYKELRRLFDYLCQRGQIGPKIAGQPSSDKDSTIYPNGSGNPAVEICVVDADDLLDNPSDMIEAYCRSVGIDYDPQMLNWDNEEDQHVAEKAFEKWPGFHDDAIDSKELKPRLRKRKVKSGDEYYEWRDRYGEDAARTIRETVDKNVADYEYLKQFALKF